ncbi:MAG: hypothetical protein PHR83_00720 [Paludibacter sp.]|nr:hypothetical protein [Paludibacter sp.]
MKKYLVIILFCLGSHSYAQDRISVSTSKSGTIIEVSEYSHILAYRLGPASANILKNGLNTALKWIDLNSIHQKNFEKEICRFKAMDYETYKFHGYIDQLASEMRILFNGNSDGTFELLIGKYDSRQGFLSFSDKATILDFIDLLNGKSVNNEIDDIFKR